MSSISQSDKIYKARHYALGILVVVYTFNFIDRQILSILLEPVRLIWASPTPPWAC